MDDKTIHDLALIAAKMYVDINREEYCVTGGGKILVDDLVATYKQAYNQIKDDK